MSVFDNHLDRDIIDRDTDKMILEQYKISNSGATLIPKKGTFALTKEQKGMFRRQPKLSPLPEGTFREESSIFKMFSSRIWKLSVEDQHAAYDTYVEIVRSMNLPCLVYNQKRYYNVNREIKRKIAHQLFLKTDTIFEAK